MVEKEKSSDESHNVSSVEEDEEEEEEEECSSAAVPAYNDEVEEEVNMASTLTKASKHQSLLPGQPALKPIAPSAPGCPCTTKWWKSTPVQSNNVVHLDSSEEEQATGINISSSAATPVQKPKRGDCDGTPQMQLSLVFVCA
jgi:hypothetical protein